MLIGGWVDGAVGFELQVRAWSDASRLMSFNSQIKSYHQLRASRDTLSCRRRALFARVVDEGGNPDPYYDTLEDHRKARSTISREGHPRPRDMKRRIDFVKSSPYYGDDVLAQIDSDAVQDDTEPANEQGLKVSAIPIHISIDIDDTGPQVKSDGHITSSLSGHSPRGVGDQLRVGVAVQRRVAAHRQAEHSLQFDL
ncbi:hypothetical protein EVAR_78923_1 [Eumeta japonica]|uniref:Uncharacterized protein n=1 Tax=Eumeta variegata TaxID=151549 RepID=A0A4C1U3B3_EUMVA|nr:hypothetical protein EVAR_78923_1 [Eumeta japonica]